MYVTIPPVNSKSRRRTLRAGLAPPVEDAAVVDADRVPDHPRPVRIDPVKVVLKVQ